MKNVFVRLNTKGFFPCFKATALKVFLTFRASLLFMFSVGYAQAPHISYASPQVYHINTAINPLSPTNTGGAVPVPTPVALGRAADITGIGVDAKGNVYVGSLQALEIVEFPATGGNPIVLAGGIKPVGMAVDAAGDVYFGKQNNSVCKLPARANGAIITIITAQAEPVGFAIDSAGNLYYSEQARGDVKELPAGSNTPVVIATGFSNPQGVAVDATGNVYVADIGNSAVKKIQAGSRTITTLTVGSGSANVDGVAVDAFGNVYFVNINNTTVTEIPVGGGSNVVISSQLLNPIAIAIDGKGNLYIANTNQGGNTNTNYVQELPAGGYTISPLPPAGLSLSTRTGVISGTPTTASPATNYTVTATNSSGSSMATVNIKVLQGSNKSLSHLTLSHGVLSPAFATATTSYTASVAGTISSVSLTPTTTNSIATVTVNGTTVTSGSASPNIPLFVGPNTINVVVDSATTESDYTVTITRAASPQANLSLFKISRGTLTPAFSSTTTSYTASVANGVSSMTVTPTAAYAGATIKVNGTTVASGSPSGAIPLNVGQNTINTVVTSSDGTVIKTYTLVVTEAVSTNANLSSLKSSRGAYTPSFNPNTTSYTASVVNGVTSTIITPTAAAPNGTIIKVNGTVVASGSPSGAIPLSVGANTINTVVTASDGATTKTYTLTITRAGSPGNIVADNSLPASISTQPEKTLVTINDGIVVDQGISPNGDGINDYLVIDGILAYPDNKLSVINRNGALVFETKGYDNASKVFDGHSNKTGKMQLPGTYFYSLEYTVKGITKHKTGFIILKY